MARHAHETSQEMYFTPESDTFVAPEVVEGRLDRTLGHEARIGHFAVSLVLSEELVAQQEVMGTPIDLARAHMKHLSIPLYEYLAARNRNTAVDQETAAAANATYRKAASVLDTFVTRRDSTEHSPENKYTLNQLSGAISELTFFSLLLRNRHQHGYIALPSNRHDDHAPRDVTGKRHSFDFSVLNERMPNERIDLQVKTARNHLGAPYARSVPVISTEELTGDYFKGKYSLPLSLIHDSEHTATERETTEIATASSIAVRALRTLGNGKSASA